jgi:hypothetical protein
MMTHPLVDQLRFTRSEFVRSLKGVSENDAERRLLPMNCISWIVGHLAHQENVYWVLQAQDKALYPDLCKLVGWGYPASTPALREMWTVWHEVTAAADEYLETVTSRILRSRLVWRGERLLESVGTMLLRNTHHYWFHLGEAHAIRQMLGHKDLPQFVGDMSKVPYHPE